MTKEELKKHLLDLEGFDFEAFEFENEFSAKGILKAMDEYAQQAIAEHEASKTVIKAKALRKKGTDKWYQIDYVALDDGNFPFRTRRLPDLWHDEYRKDGIGFVAESNLPSDAELIDIEIIVKAGGER